MANLNEGKPYHVMPTVKGCSWPEAQQGDRIRIHNGDTIKEYEFNNGDWFLRSTAYAMKE